MSVNSKYTAREILARELARFLDKYNNPVLGPAEQSELYAMVFRDAGYNARMVMGHVWVPHKDNRPPFDESAVKYDSNFRAYRLQNHIWVKVKSLIVDLRLRQALGSDHPSIPHGVFEPIIHQKYRYQEIADVKFYKIQSRIAELYHCQELSQLSEKPKHPGA